jgi:catechol 2,3-dioxygenase-like lactoylglutathione lyase family enzyme
VIHALHHVALSVRDMDRALAFYRDLLGWHVVYDRGFGGRRVEAITALPGALGRSVLLRLGSSRLELFAFEQPVPTPRTSQREVHELGLTHLCFKVDSIDAEYQRLLAAGVPFHAEPQDFGSFRATYGRDPDGNVFELLEVTGADSPM